jgi:cardiolipin synthase
MADDQGEDRILTVPNVISLVRLSCLPLFLYVLFGLDDRVAAAFLLFGLGATDWVDGYIARRWNQVSTLGKVLDPVADRLLFFVGVGGILVDGSVPAWFGWAVLVREAVVSITTIAIALAGAKRVDVTWAGKAGTFCLMGAFPLFLLGASDFRWADAAEVLAWGVGIPGLVLSYVAAAMYIPIGLRALEEGRAARTSEAPVSSG